MCQSKHCAEIQPDSEPLNLASQPLPAKIQGISRPRNSAMLRHTTSRSMKSERSDANHTRRLKSVHSNRKDQLGDEGSESSKLSGSATQPSRRLHLGVQRMDDNGKYEGQLLENSSSGLGVMTCRDGSRYAGQVNSILREIWLSNTLWNQKLPNIKGYGRELLSTENRMSTVHHLLLHRFLRSKEFF